MNIVSLPPGFDPALLDHLIRIRSKAGDRAMAALAGGDIEEAREILQAELQTGMHYLQSEGYIEDAQVQSGIQRCSCGNTILHSCGRIRIPNPDA